MKLFYVALIFATGCAAMQQRHVDKVCNTEGSYNQGYNDGHGRGRMDSSFADMCPSDKDTIRRAYHDGFNKGAAVKAAVPRPIEVQIVHEGGVPAPAWECRQSFGQKFCGYDCREEYGLVKCAKAREDNCVAAFGTIKCGYRCREEFGEIQCDRYE